MTALQPDRRALMLLLATGAAAVAPLVTELPLWATLLAGASGVWRYFADQLNWRHPGRALRWTLVLVTVVAVHRQFGYLLGRDPGLALLVALLGLKFLELRSARDCVVSLLLLFVVLAGAYTYGQALWLGPYTLMVVMLGALTLLQLTQPTGLARPARVRLVAVLLLQAIPLALVAFVLFPRVQGSLWALPHDSHRGRLGLSEEMRPGSINELSESEAIAFRVAFAGAAPRPEALYWRTLVLWDTDGQRWSRGASIGASGPPAPLGVPLRYTVTLEPSNKPWLPVLDVPRAPPAGARLDNAYTVARPEPVRERLSYTLESVARYAASGLSATERQRALALPQRLGERTRALAARWRAQHAGDRSVAQAALRHFREEDFVYTLSPPLLGVDPVDEFLFETRRGYCEHYAAAFVTLMRAAGLPARVVLGYQGGEYNAAGNYYIVQEADAHAWAEVWLADSGWARVDPTAAVAPERIELGSFALRRLAERGVRPGTLPGEALARALELTGVERIVQRARLYWDLANVSWYQWVAAYDRDLQAQLVRALGFAQAGVRELVFLMAAVGTAVLMAQALWMLRARARRDPVEALYARYCRELARVGLVRGTREGPLLFAQRCRAQRPQLTGVIEQVTALYIGLRYGTGADAAQLRALRDAVTAFRIA
jgi:transglutaminase-like putative cysteine protease